MNEVGYVYVPHECINAGDGEPCKIHVAFHGCKQTLADVDMQYMKTTGLAAWAGANRLVMLFPQTQRTTANPNGCWDWWGFTGVDYASKLGVQMKAVHKMVSKIAASSAIEFIQ